MSDGVCGNRINAHSPSGCFDIVEFRVVLDFNTVFEYKKAISKHLRNSFRKSCVGRSRIGVRDDVDRVLISSKVSKLLIRWFE